MCADVGEGVGVGCVVVWVVEEDEMNLRRCMCGRAGCQLSRRQSLRLLSRPLPLIPRDVSRAAAGSAAGDAEGTPLSSISVYVCVCVCAGPGLHTRQLDGGDMLKGERDGWTDGIMGCAAAARNLSLSRCAALHWLH